MDILMTQFKAQRDYQDETWAQYLGNKPKNFFIRWQAIRYVSIDYDGEAAKCIIRCRNRARRLTGNFWEFYCTLKVPLEIEHAEPMTVLSPLHVFRFNHNYAYDRDSIPEELHIIELDFRAKKVRAVDALYADKWVGDEFRG